MKDLRWSEYGLMTPKYTKQDLIDNLAMLRKKQAKYLSEQRYYVSKPAKTRAYRIQILKRLIDEYPEDEK